MAKFNAATAVESLDWDFTAFGGGEGVVPEPSTKRINTFFAEIRALAKDARELRGQAEGLSQVEESDDLTDEQMDEVLGSMDEATAKAVDFQQRSVEAIAALCGADWVESGDYHEDGTPKLVLKGGSPSLDQLETLPYRVLQEFTRWITDEIRPKTSRNQPVTRPSRKGSRRSGS